MEPERVDPRAFDGREFEPEAVAAAPLLHDLEDDVERVVGVGRVGLDHRDGAEGARAADAAGGRFEFVGIEDLVRTAKTGHVEDAILAHPVRAPDDDVAVAKLPARREPQVRGDGVRAVIGHDALIADLGLGVAELAPSRDGGERGGADGGGRGRLARGVAFGDLASGRQGLHDRAGEGVDGARPHLHHDRPDPGGRFERRDGCRLAPVNGNRDDAAVMAEIVERAEKPAVFGPRRGEKLLAVVHALIGERRKDRGGAEAGGEVVLGRDDLEGEGVERDRGHGNSRGAEGGREKRCADPTPDQDGQPREVLPAFCPQ